VLSPISPLLLFIESFFSYFQSKNIANHLVEKWNPHIIHTHDQLGSGLIGKYLKEKYCKPLLVTVHGQDIMHFSKKLLTGSLIWSTLKSSDAIICVSEALQKEIKLKGKINTSFYVLPMGAKSDFFKPKEQHATRRKLGLPTNKRIALFVGNLIPLKGVEYFIKAIKISSDKDSTLEAYIIGEGSQELELKNLINKLNLNPIVKLLGYKSNKEVSDYMNACDIFVLPSLTEGLPVVLCEAISCGKPVVATRVGGNSEIVNSDVGYLVSSKDEKDLANKMLLALHRRWDKKKILQRASKFNVDFSAQQLIKIYAKTLTKNSNNG
jgi:glycosyltransferase involved in cell wall biosynthesis